MPAWTIQPYADRGSDKDLPELNSESAQGSATLERTLASVEKAEDMVFVLPWAATLLCNSTIVLPGATVSEP